MQNFGVLNLTSVELHCVIPVDETLHCTEISRATITTWNSNFSFNVIFTQLCCNDEIPANKNYAMIIFADQ